MEKDVTFEEELLALGKEVISVLMKRGSTKEDAEDAVSKTYDTLFSSMMSLSPENLRPWFFRVAFNRYIDLFRKKKREKELVFTYIEAQTEVSYQPQQLWMLLEALKNEEQELLLLKYYYRLSYEEIATMLEMKVEIVKKKLYRVRKKMKDTWEV